VYSDRGPWPWHRYLAFAERLTVVSRMRRLPAGVSREGLDVAGQEGVQFVGVPSLSTPVGRVTNLRTVTHTLEEVLGPADALVARLSSEIGAQAVKVARKLGRPWAVELVTCTWDSLWNYGTWQGRVYAPVSWLDTRRLVADSPWVLYVTDAFLQRRYPTRGRAVGCSDIDLPGPEEGVLERRLARIEAGRAPLVIGTVAALSLRFKGLQTALAALERVGGELPQWEYRVLGAGDPEPWADLAERLGVGDKVVFSGTRPPGAPVLEWLDEVDIYLQPSFVEGLPRALVEAMSRACPALGSTAGGIPELLAEECLHEPGDEGRLAELLLETAADPDRQRRQAERNFGEARRYSKERLDRIRAEFWRDFAESATRR
jgi:glycosyltransferase involved in cell wall biosynthesis